MLDGDIFRELSTQGVGHCATHVIVLIIFGSRGRRRPLAGLEVTVIGAVFILKFPSRAHKPLRQRLAAGDDGGVAGSCGSSDRKVIVVGGVVSGVR